MLKVFVLSLLISLGALAEDSKYEKMQKDWGIVKITSENLFAGTGTLISGKEVITAKHVCNSGKIRVWFNEIFYDVEELYMADKSDLCYIKMYDPIKAKSFKLAKKDPLYNETVCGIGYPNNEFSFSCGPTQGFLRVIDSKYELDDYLLFSNYYIDGGMSGGPVVNKSWELVGISVAMHAAHDMALFVPLSTIKRFLNESR